MNVSMNEWMSGGVIERKDASERASNLEGRQIGRLMITQGIYRHDRTGQDTIG